MAEKTRSAKQGSSPNWLASLMGAVFLISAGFMLGLIVGVVKEEPELVMGHLGGQSEEVLWSEEEAPLATPDVAAQGPVLGATDGLSADAELSAGDGPGLVEPLPNPLAEDAVGQNFAEVASLPVYEPPVPAPAPRAMASRSAQSAGIQGFSIQVGAFAESGPAERIAQDLRAKNFSVYITPSAGSRNGRWRVRVGPMPTRAEADRVAKQLKTREQLPTWVVNEGEGS